MPEQEPRKRGFPVLLVQLVVANIIVAGAVTATLYWLFTGLMDSYFHTLMDEFDISPTKLNTMFVTDVEQSLWWGIAVALALGIGLSLLLTTRLLRPISKMAEATEKIASGDLSARSPALRGELGALAWHFNGMADALEQQETTRQQLLRDLSHELRTPLTNVKGYIEGLEDGVFTVGPEVLNVLNAEVQRLSDLIDDLTELGSSEAVAGQLQLEAVDLGEALTSVIAAHKSTMMENDFSVHIEEIGAARPVAADHKRLHQILNNAIANMVRYAQKEAGSNARDKEGLISLDWSARDHVKICFENTTQPISPDDLARLFDRFYRVDPSRAGTSHNVGLGLSIIKRLVIAHGGKVWVEQTGGRFKLYVWLLLADKALG